MIFPFLLFLILFSLDSIFQIPNCSLPLQNYGEDQATVPKNNPKELMISKILESCTAPAIMLLWKICSCLSIQEQIQAR